MRFQDYFMHISGISYVANYVYLAEISHCYIIKISVLSGVCFEVMRQSGHIDEKIINVG